MDRTDTCISRARATRIPLNGEVNSHDLVAYSRPQATFRSHFFLRPSPPTRLDSFVLRIVCPFPQLVFPSLHSFAVFFSANAIVFAWRIFCSAPLPRSADSFGRTVIAEGNRTTHSAMRENANEVIYFVAFGCSDKTYFHIMLNKLE